MDAYQFQVKTRGVQGAEMNLPFIDSVEYRCVTHICGHVDVWW